MKKIFARISTWMMNSLWLCVAMIAVLIVIGIMGWGWSLQVVEENFSEESIKSVYQREMHYTEEADINLLSSDMDYYRSLSMEVYGGQSYLYDQSGEVVFGPCKLIYDDLEYSDSNSVFRYIDNNGLIGFGEIEEAKVNILYEGIFSEASRLSDGSACVREGDNYYYIDKNGKRFTIGKYLMAYPFECQGNYARVQLPNGSWSIINSQEDQVLSGFDSINELTNCTFVGSGVKNGKAVLFSLDTDNGQHCITHEYEEYVEINYPYEDADFAFVKTENGRDGIICISTGNIVAPAIYMDVEWGYLESGSGEIQEQVWFRCMKEDGTYDVHFWRFEETE